MLNKKYCQYCGYELHWYDRIIVKDIPHYPGIDRHPQRGWYHCMHCGWSGKADRRKPGEKNGRG